MILSLVKDVLDFARRHFKVLLFFIFPLQFFMVLLFSASGVEEYVSQYMSQMAQMEAEQAPAPGLDTGRTGDAMTAGDTPPEQIQPLQPMPIGSMLLFLVYLAGSVYPIAVLILYIKNVFAGDPHINSTLYQQAVPLWLQMIGLYICVWGSLLLVSGFFFLLINLLGLTSLTSLFFPIIFGVSLYVHHRLSLAPYFCAQRQVSIKEALRSSWQEAKSYVLILIVGQFIFYMTVIMLVNLFGQLLQQITPESVHNGVQIMMNSLASFGGLLQSIYVYRVFALVEEKPAV